MFRITSFFCAFFSIACVGHTAEFQDHGTASQIQTWSISFADETAVLRASPDTEVGFIQSIIKALQENGIEKFAFRSETLTPEKLDDHSVAVRLRNGEAELLFTVDLPYKHVVTIISMLADKGVDKFKFATPKPNKASP